MNNSPLLSRRQVADILNFHTETIKRMEKRGDLPAVRIGSRSVRYHPDAVDSLIRRSIVSKKNSGAPYLP
jgi:excisionase family DNA binding protein